MVAGARLSTGRGIRPLGSERIMHSRRLAADVTALQDCVAVPGLGVLPINAFLLHAAQPILVDTGFPTSTAAFVQAVGNLVDPADLRWIWLSHPDRDHTGSLYELLELAPQARVVTTFVGLGILSVERRIRRDRVFLLNPGQSLDLGDRTLTAFRPPLYDSPATIGFSDSRTGTVFSSDCFGCPAASPEQAVAADVAEIPAGELARGQRLWATIDFPWVTGVDRAAFARSLDTLRVIDPPLLLSSHLPPATGRAAEFLDRLTTIPDEPPYVGPDQAALEQLLRKLDPQAGRAPAAQH
jgi:hypothetical protein